MSERIREMKSGNGTGWHVISPLTSFLHPLPVVFILLPFSQTGNPEDMTPLAAWVDKNDPLSTNFLANEPPFSPSLCTAQTTQKCFYRLQDCLRETSPAKVQGPNMETIHQEHI